MRKLLILAMLIFGINWTVGAEEYIVCNDSCFLVISPDTAEAPAYNDSSETSPNFAFIRLGKKVFKNPLYRIFKVQKKDKTTAVVLTIFTGVFGMHRLYLGTKPVVPVVYTFTLGGGVGILPFIDLVVLLFSSDITRFENNNKIFMWVR